jgi:hypothetical protein
MRRGYSDLSDEEKDKVFIGLLREWFILTENGLTEVAGIERGLKVLKPYCVNMGQSGGPKMREFVGMKIDDAPSMEAFWMGVCQRSAGNGKVRLFSDERDRVVAEVSECAIAGRSKLACFTICEMIGNFGFQSLFPEYEGMFTEAVPYGDPVCRFVVWRKGTQPKLVQNTEVEMPLIPQFKMDFVSLATLGELWANTTRALIDVVGSEGTSETLLPRMRDFGRQFGMNYLQESSRQETTLTGNDSMITKLSQISQRKGRYWSDGTTQQGEVVECPFSGSPPEICLQFQAFFNGICEAIDPSYEFAYDRMMTKGDKACHWTIRRKGEAAKEKAKDEATTDDPVKTLTMRFARGEITEEELERKLAHLRKLGLVK